MRPDHEKRLRFVLAALDEARNPNELEMPGYRLHPLIGQLAGFWSKVVIDNWRIVFRLIETDLERVDQSDYG
ncbi:type II toxin-antitoxin system RelE/ParE family toxin [Pseudomonas syringae group sp. J309-1]|uniref:type II toxin-antitoxin system RelE/ParE family toxin n=1 Tax=Pseudomonas syringae group sp. J309-1 TaxID=3079588 RepID=UPI003977AAE2